MNDILMKNLENDGADQEDVNSEAATGVGTDADQDNGVDGLSDDMSDNGCDTDLEIEGSDLKSLCRPCDLQCMHLLEAASLK